MPLIFYNGNDYNNFTFSFIDLGNSIILFLPELFLLSSIFFFLLSELWFLYNERVIKDFFYNIIIIIILFLCLLLFLNKLLYKNFLVSREFSLFYLHFTINYNIIIQQIFVTLFFLFFLISSYNQFLKLKITQFEYFLFLLFSLLGLNLLLLSSHLLTVVFSIELISFSIYPLLVLKKNSKTTFYTCLVYFCNSVFISLFLLFSISLLSHIITVYSFIELQLWVVVSTMNINNLLISFPFMSILFCIILFLIAFSFKLGFFPFHFWLLPVYNQSLLIIMFFLSTVIKLGFFLFFINFFMDTFYFSFFAVRHFLYYISVGSMLVGSIGMYSQDNIKYFLSYSSISHFGFMLSALCSFSEYSILYIYYYLITYLLTVFCLFIILFNFYTLCTEEEDFTSPVTLNNLIKLQKSPFLINFFVILLALLSGLPPFSSFFAKVLLILCLLQSNLFFLSFVFILSSFFSIYIYLNLIAGLLFTKTETVSKTYKISFFYYIICVCIVGILSGLSIYFFLQFQPFELFKFIDYLITFYYIDGFCRDF